MAVVKFFEAIFYATWFKNPMPKFCFAKENVLIRIFSHFYTGYVNEEPERNYLNTVTVEDFSEEVIVQL